MSADRTLRFLSRRAAVGSLGAGGMALALGAHAAIAQNGTPASFAGHPLVGAWVVDPDADTPGGVPSLLVFTADGIVLAPAAGFAGAWEATDARTARSTICGLVEGATSGYLILRGDIVVDAAGTEASGPYTRTVVAPDGNVLTTSDGTRTMRRIPVESGDAGTPLRGFPTWTPAPAEATPAG
jgi:hypothetical protein